MAKNLLVEDNEMNRDMLARRLGRRGHEVLVAVDGAEGLELARREMPTLILMDMTLPVLDGWEATRRIKAGLNPAVASVASLFISRWDVAIKDKVPRSLTNRLGIAVAQRTYRAYQERLASNRAHRLGNEGARIQRLLWASTGTKDPSASDILYVEALAAPFTVNTMPEGTLKAFADLER